MKRLTKTLAVLAMLAGIIGLICVADLNGSPPQPTPVPTTSEAAITYQPVKAEPVEQLIQSTPVPPRVSVSFDDGSSKDYALLKGVPPTGKHSDRPDIDIWYGESDQHYPILPASPVEREASRIYLKISFTF